MPKTQPRQNVCSECGTPVTDPYKTWELVVPFPNKKSRITVTVYECPKRGKKLKAVTSKTKL